MVNGWMRLGILLAAATLGASGAMAEIVAPPVGTSMAWKCEGPYGSDLKGSLVANDGGTLRFEGTMDGKAIWTERSAGTLGLTIFHRRDRNDGNGVRKQSYDEDDFRGYADLVPGSTFEGDVRERHDNGRWTWGYKITVGEPKRIDHPVLGNVEVVPVTESRQVWQGRYNSVMEFVLAPRHGVSVSWKYKDNRGTQSCELVEHSLP